MERGGPAVVQACRHGKSEERETGPNDSKYSHLHIATYHTIFLIHLLQADEDTRTYSTILVYYFFLQSRPGFYH